MKKDNVIDCEKPETFIDNPLTDILRKGARKLLAEALEVEIETFLSYYDHLKDSRGRQRITRNGYLPEREIQTGIGAVKAKVPRVRDRQPEVPSERIYYSSSILPPYLSPQDKKHGGVDSLVYPKGVSTGDFSEALAALIGKDAPGLSPATISRLKDVWQDELDQWQQRDLSSKRYVLSISGPTASTVTSGWKKDSVSWSLLVQPQMEQRN